jgi:hypothetical protein
MRQIFAVASWGLLLAVIGPNVQSSRSSLTLDEFQQVIKFGTLAVPTIILSLAFIKISVACLILRFQQNRAERIFLHALIAFITATHTGFFLFVFLQCRPLAATWNMSIRNGKCVGTDVVGRVSNTNTGVTISTDIILSIFPVTFLRQIRRPLMEKVLIGVLMAMGMAAAGVSVAKAVVTHQWVAASDSLSMGARISMLSCLELFIGITAACSPSFKPTVQRFMVSLGITFRSRYPFSFFRSHNESASPDEIPPGPLQEFNTHSNVTVKSNVFSFSEMEGLSKESTQVVVESPGCMGEQERSPSRASERIHGPGEVV